MTGPVTRLDRAVVERGLARSRTHAQQLIKDACVSVDGEVVTRASTGVGAEQSVSLSEVGHETRRWVGRGAFKMLAALREFPAVAHAVQEGRCLDVGASTGGFTQVLLEAGAREVVALDVGHDQLDPVVSGDPRVRELSGTNARDVSARTLGRVDVLACDVSFISLSLLVDVVADLLVPLGHAVLLVKPQFEVGRERIGDGVVNDPVLWRSALESVVREAQAQRLEVHGLAASPVAGTHGNREFLLWLRPAAAGAPRLTPDALQARIGEVTAPLSG